MKVVRMSAQHTDRLYPPPPQEIFLVLPGEERVGCEVLYSPPPSAKVVQAPRHKEVRTIRIIALGILNLHCRRGAWIASVIGRFYPARRSLLLPVQ